MSTPAAAFTSNPLDMMSRRPSTCNLATSGHVSPTFTHVSHASVSRPTTAFADNQPLIVLRKQDLDDFLKEQSEARLESRMDNVR